MPSPLSTDLRTRAVHAYEAGEGTQEEIAKRYNIDRSTLVRWLQKKRTNGTLKANWTRRGAVPRLTEEHQEILREALRETSHRTSEELKELLHEKAKIEISARTIRRVLQQIQWTRKKKKSEPPNKMTSG